MKSDYPKIFEPITIKRTTIKNRIAMTPMGTNYGETSGEMSNRHMNYYSLRAKGGTGLSFWRMPTSSIRQALMVQVRSVSTMTVLCHVIISS